MRSRRSPASPSSTRSSPPGATTAQSRSDPARLQAPGLRPRDRVFDPIPIATPRPPDREVGEADRDRDPGGERSRGDVRHLHVAADAGGRVRPPRPPDGLLLRARARASTPEQWRRSSRRRSLRTASRLTRWSRSSARRSRRQLTCLQPGCRGLHGPRAVVGTSPPRRHQRQAVGQAATAGRNPQGTPGSTAG